MNTINANTKISAILKQHPDALEAIISISPSFNKLRNPLLRKLMSSRTSINMASKIGGCSVNDFFEKLQPLGFVIDKDVIAEKGEAPTKAPNFMKNLSSEKVVVMDVRSVLDEGKDPFNMILKKVNQLEPHQVLKLVNTFEPVPLIQILGKKGFETYTEFESEQLVNTYFYKADNVKTLDVKIKSANDDWDTLMKKYEKNINSIDVRNLEMPLPMLTILDELETLPEENALYVYHKRIPVFLLPELQDRKFEYRIKEISDDEVHLLIFKL